MMADYVYIGRPRCVEYARHYQVMFDVDKPTCAGCWRCRTTCIMWADSCVQAKGDEESQCSMSPDYCLQDIGDGGSRCPAMNKRCEQYTVFVVSPRVTPTMNDDGCTRPTLALRCVLDKGDTRRPCLMTAEWCSQYTTHAAGQWSMSPERCEHAWTNPAVHE